MAEVWGGFSDGVAVEGEPGVEDGNVKKWFGLCNCVEWMGEVVNVKGKWWAMQLDYRDKD